MKLYAYRGAEPNFGDELNHFIMPRLFPGFFDEDESSLFLGIGSILSRKRPSRPMKLVFGSGYGGRKYGPPPDVVGSQSWKIYCVRGPLTAKALGLGVHYVAADPAIYLNRYIGLKAHKKYRFSFMPHYQSLNRANWPALADEAGLHFIDPRLDVETVLAEILASEIVVAEAMHGVIVADALRVPWIALQPTDSRERVKWFDWAQSLKVDLRPAHLNLGSAKDALRLVTGKTYSGRWVNKALSLLDRPFEIAALSSLKAAMLTAPNLSAQTELEAGLARLDSARAMIHQDFGSQENSLCWK